MRTPAVAVVEAAVTAAAAKDMVTMPQAVQVVQVDLTAEAMLVKEEQEELGAREVLSVKLETPETQAHQVIMVTELVDPVVREDPVVDWQVLPSLVQSH